MKILVVHVSAGAGHKRAAEAIFNCLKKNFPAYDIQIIDILDKTNPLFRFIYLWGYSFVVRYTASLWGFFFWLTENKFLCRLTRGIALIVNKINTQSFARFLIQENPDYIISTHFLPSEVVSGLKQANKIKSKVVTVITDFGVHPFWLNSKTDLYVAASDFTKDRLISEGVREESIKVLGIPVDVRFTELHNKEALCKKFNIDSNLFTVLVMTGSFGVGPLEAIVSLLEKDAQILVVCATNKRLFLKLKKKKLVNARILGFVDNTEELMAVSDVIITKPGGLSIAEILNMEIAPIFISAILGQEEENVRVLKEYGIGISPQSVPEIREIIMDFKNQPHKLEAVRENIRKIKRPNAAKEICNVVCKGGLGDSC